MTFSKFRYAIACFLLIGASGLLVSCSGVNVEPKPQLSQVEKADKEKKEKKADEGLVVEIPTDCVATDEKPTVIRKKTTSEEKSKRTEKAPTEPDAGCIIDS